MVFKLTDLRPPDEVKAMQAAARRSSASAVTRDGTFELSAKWLNWRHVARQIGDYLLRRDFPDCDPDERGLSPRTADRKMFLRSRSSLDTIAVQSSQAIVEAADTRLQEEMAWAILADEASECGTQVQVVPVPVRYWVKYNRGHVFRWFDADWALSVWRENWKPGDREAIARLIEMISPCMVRRGEPMFPKPTIRRPRYRVASSQLAAVIPPPRHATPLASLAMDNDGNPIARFDSVFAAELPFLPRFTPHPDAPRQTMTPQQIDQAIESLQALKQAAEKRQQAAKPLSYVTHRPQYWSERMYADCRD